ncbi:9660_t:CDS:1, partial [Scutellospora calospora]
AKRKNLWSERWYCHRYGAYESVAGKDTNKKPRLVQKETKKCGCKSYINIVLPVNSSMVTLKYYYKHRNHYPGKLSDLCTLPLSENIRQFIQQRAFEGLDVFSIQKLMRHRAIELQNQ